MLYNPSGTPIKCSNFQKEQFNLYFLIFKDMKTYILGIFRDVINAIYLKLALSCKIVPFFTSLY